ncbi:MAG: UvrD-helicase domain-containing protein [Clostridia bacterium]|nr:UvrD-helicase domain-containing protein [Clostridia bacterium]
MDDKNSLIEQTIKKIKTSKQRYENFLKQDRLLDDDLYDSFVQNNPVEKKLHYFFDQFSLNPLVIKDFLKYKRISNDYYSYIKQFNLLIKIHNNEYYKKRKEFFLNNCKTVEDNWLDDSQIDSIIHEDKNQLVIAGAGCGKTTTIIGKVKYLLKSEFAKPEDVLLLSFTNASATEMGERVRNELEIDNFDSYTFHKLGLEIIKEALNKDVKIYQGNLNEFIKEKLEVLIKDKDYFDKLVLFFANYIHDVKDEFEFTNEQEYKEYLQVNPPTTLKGEVVKSYGELEIANFLFINNIDYVYEKEYEYDVATKYNPDFYLPKEKIYIEYFGINRKKQVPEYFIGKNGKTASQTYLEGIEWKKKIHKNNNTILIDLYYYNLQDDELLEKLREKLEKNEVELKPKSHEEIWKEVQENNKGLLDEISRTFQTIINLIKSNDFSFMDVIKKAKNFERRKSIEDTISLIEPIYNMYDQELKKTDSIDFNDMINLASKCINEGKFSHTYKYVIVDEYQDISKARYNLLQALRNNHFYKLFCVGDDWQSIYRFSGSDLDLIVNFKKYFGKTYISNIENTFRFSQQLADVSQEFIMKNPNQLKKKIVGKDSNYFPIDEVQAYNDIRALQFLEDKLNEFEKDSTVYFLGRYNFDRDIFKDNNNFYIKYNNQTGLEDITYYPRKDLKIKFLTVHKSKGLQADYVILINNKKNGMGFPSKLNDIPAIRVLLSDCDSFPFSEERRLFYVALTRCKKKIILLTIKDNVSIFAKEIINKYASKIKKEQFRCPKCLTGTLVKKNGQYGEFLGCSNYPNCDFTKNIGGKNYGSSSK